MELLVDAGADGSFKSFEGKTAFDYLPEKFKDSEIY